MPIDSAGNRADVVMDSASVIGRMNLARLFEHYTNSTIRDVAKTIRDILGIHVPEMGAVKPLKPVVTFNQMSQIDSDVFNHAYMYLMRLYQTVSEPEYQHYAFSITEEQRLEHMVAIVNEGIQIFWDIRNDKHTPEVIKQLESAFKPTFGPVSYVGDSGVRVTTKSNVRIGPLYVMLLDKIADDWSSVATGRLQHFGVLSPTTKNEKFSSPHRNSPVRTIGETEGRIFAGYCGREAIAEMMDRSNSPATQRNISWNILNAKEPTNIEHVVDRDFIRLGGAKPLQLIRHMLGTAGYGIVYEPEAPVVYNTKVEKPTIN